VSFSGGRDSSTVLAVTTEVARREGLPEPIPVTLRFLEAPNAVEDDYQEKVVRHIGLRDWERIEIADELEFTGPIAATALRRHGVLFPATAFLLLPALERARGGTLIAAFGGSDMFLFWRWARVADLLAGRARPRRGDLRPLAMAALPRALRGALARRLAPPDRFPWLRDSAASEVVRILAQEVGTEPVRFNKAIETHRRHRCFSAAVRSLRALADGAGSSVSIPTYDPAYLGAVARDGGRTGWGDRTQMMLAMAGDLLPEEVLARRERSYVDVYYGPRLRAFADSWSGGGLDDSLVDPAVLREVWRGERPDLRSTLLLHAAWLHDDRRQSGAERDEPHPVASAGRAGNGEGDGRHSA
jgi:asparagine synthase (glutamine-hydrolysing)